MKRLLTFAMMLLFAAAVYAQSNDKISYQAVVRTTDNKLVYNQNLTVTISVANSETGSSVYGEQHAVTSNANGLISLMIGDGTSKTGNWSDIQWNNAWVTATIMKGSETIATHHVPMSAVPYALYAKDMSLSQQSAKFTATADQTAFALTVPSGMTLDYTKYTAQMYINGVFVGDTQDGVLTVSGTTATYVPANNGDYALMAGDRVQIVYWVK